MIFAIILEKMKEGYGMKLSKKLFIMGVVIAITGGMCAYAANITKFSSKFIKKFKDCESYQETITSNYEGNTFTTDRKIIGWSGGFCKYEEVVKSPTEIYKLNCRFSSIQVDDLYDSMKDKSNNLEDFGLETFVEHFDEKTGKTSYISNGITTIKGNKAYITWAKYQNNPYFCKPEKLK